MYRFKTRDGQWARITPDDVKHIIPSGTRTGYVKLVLGGGHAVTIEGEADAIHEILMQYRLHPTAPSDAAELSDAERALLPSAVSDAREATAEFRSALNGFRDRLSEAEATTPSVDAQ